jgi:hypothetical protein
MKCISCEIQIDQKWKFAIQNNVCPNCGDSIMDEHLKVLLADLASCMVDLQGFPKEVDDWLHSNYGYVKVDSETFHDKYVEINSERFYELAPRGAGSPGKFAKKLVKIKDDQGNETEVEESKLQSDATTQSFFDRAMNKSASSAESPTDKILALKQAAERARSGGAQMLYLKDVPDEGDAQDEVDVAPTPGLRSGIVSQADDEEADIDAHLARLQGGGASGKELREYKMLEAMQNRLAGSANRLKSGKGAFGR